MEVFLPELIALHLSLISESLDSHVILCQIVSLCHHRHFVCSIFSFCFSGKKKYYFENRLIQVRTISPKLYLLKIISVDIISKIDLWLICPCVCPLLLMPVEVVSVFIWRVFYIRKVGNRNVFLLLENKRNILLTIVYLLLACTKTALIF